VFETPMNELYIVGTKQSNKNVFCSKNQLYSIKLSLA
jgi:hypothetical protein